MGPETCVGVGTWEGLQGWAGPLFYINNKQRAGQVTPETRKVPPCFEYDVNGEDEGYQDVGVDELDDIVEEHSELPGENTGE